MPVVFYVTPPNSRNTDEAYDHLPALVFDAEMQEKVNSNAVIFKVKLYYFIVIISNRKFSAPDFTTEENYNNYRRKTAAKIFRFYGAPFPRRRINQ